MCISQVRINEVSSTNGIVKDEFGDSPDWVELKNTGEEPVLLGNYYLSDDESDLFKWNFPNVVLDPNAYLVVYSEDENPSSIHFNFGLSSDGETIYLSRLPLGLEQSLAVPQLRADDTFGFDESLNGYFYFGSATPNAQNTSDPKTGYSSDFELPLNGGFYADPITIDFSDLCPSGQIHVTTTGKFPTEQDSLAQNFEVKSTSVLKGICVEDGKLPSNTSTSTFLFNETNALPIIALSLEGDSLFNDSTGLYMPGPDVDSIWPFFGANYWSDRQLKVSFEYFENQELILDQEVDLRIHGGKGSRNKPQRPFRLTARKRYGKEFIEHAFFEEKPNVDKFKHIILRNSGSDFLVSNFRDGFWHQLVLKSNLDVEVLAFQPAVVLLNGVYWGVMNIRERVSEHYISENHEISTEEIIITEKQLEPVLGDTIHFYNFKELAINSDLSIDENYSAVADQLDIASYLDYFSTEIFSGNLDWPANNIKYWKESPTSGKWRYIMFDLDTTIELFPFVPIDADVFFHIFVDKEWSVNSKIFMSLLENSEFKRNFINRLADLMNTSFSEKHLQEVLDELDAEFSGQKFPHFGRWFGNLDTYVFNTEELFPEFFSVRKGFVQEHVIEHFEVDHTVELDFQVYPENAGTIHINTITPELPFTGDYFNGNAIDLKAIPEGNSTFLKWDYSEELIEQAKNPELQRNFTRSGTITAIFEDNNTNDLSILNSPIRNNSISAVFNSSFTGDVQVHIYSLDGRLILSSTELVTEGKNVINSVASELNQGIYLYTVNSETRQFTSKFSKL